MVHAAEVLERLARDVKIVLKNFSLTPTDNLHSILGDASDWKSDSGSLSEVAYFAELIAERRAALRFSELGSPRPHRLRFGPGMGAFDAEMMRRLRDMTTRE